MTIKQNKNKDEFFNTIKEYYSTSLTSVILFYIEETLTVKDWKIESIDVVNDTVVLKRYRGV